MPATAIVHLTDLQLQAYLQGRLPAALATECDAHIEACDVCTARLSSVGSDTFSDLLRQRTLEDSDTVEEPIPEVPPELRNHPRYAIEGRLGHGGMGVVYRATHRMMGRPVALKMIRPDLLASPAAVERFRHEVRHAAKLSHANIVTAYDAEEIGGVHFLVMEFVEGRTLDRVVAKRGPLDAALACHLMRQAALGLDHAHIRGMVHRDIKPHNLIVTSTGKLRILDFGLAMMTQPDGSTPALTGEKTALGTLRYAAPEQLYCRGAVDARADQYGLGATLYFLLTGEPPPLVPRDTESTLTFADATPWPEAVPAGLRGVVNRLLAVDPAERFESSKAAAEALAPFCPAKATVALTTHSWRKTAMVAASVLICGGLVAGLLSQRRNDSSKAQNESRAIKNEDAAPAPWTPLLRQVNPNTDAVMGRWMLQNMELRVERNEGARAARLMLPAPPGPQYNLRFEFTRHGGWHSVGAVVVHNGHQVSFELDAWGEHLAGFQNINGRRITDNPTRRNGYTLQNGKRYTCEVQVRRGLVRALLDGVEVTRHASDGTDLAVDELYWKLPDSRRLALIAYESMVTFHTVEMQEVR
jgi:serine/threonine protein kinase